MCIMLWISACVYINITVFSQFNMHGMKNNCFVLEKKSYFLVEIPGEYKDSEDFSEVWIYVTRSGYLARRRAKITLFPIGFHVTYHDKKPRNVSKPHYCITEKCMQSGRIRLKSTEAYVGVIYHWLIICWSTRQELQRQKAEYEAKKKMAVRLRREMEEGERQKLVTPEVVEEERERDERRRYTVHCAYWKSSTRNLTLNVFILLV